MDVFRSLDEIPAPPAPRAVALGNFDGLHLGHRRIIERLRKEAAARALPACVLTFAPHPEKVFGPARLCMLQTLDQRLEGLCRMGIDAAIVLPFSRAFARIPGDVFIRDVIRDGLNVRLVVVGRDFRFGRDRAASVDDLRRRGRVEGFSVRAVPHVKHRGRIVRSSRIRDLLIEGRVEQASMLLGHPFTIEGDVVGGEKRGRRLGFPTANLVTPNELVPRGVFVTNLVWEGRVHPSITSVGVRPTFRTHQVTLETHVLDFDGDLYGASIGLAFLKRLRDEKKFPDVTALRRQVEKDSANARAYFRTCRSAAPFEARPAK